MCIAWPANSRRAHVIVFMMPLCAFREEGNMCFFVNGMEGRDGGRGEGAREGGGSRFDPP